MRKKNILALALMLFFSIDAFASAIDIIGEDPYVISYQISLNGQNKGYLEIKKSGKRFESKYYHITKNDRIPFYSRSKSGTLKDNLLSTKLEFNGERYEVFNDLTKREPKKLPAFLQSKSSRENRAVMVDQKTGQIKLSFEKIPMVTFENLVFGFLSGAIHSDQPMMLYEGANEIKMKIFFEKKKISGSTGCRSEKYSCFRQSVPGQASKFLFDVLVNKDGIPIEFASKSRWRFQIDKIGRIEMVRKDIKPFLLEKARKRTKEIFSRGQGRLERLKIINFDQNDTNYYNYTYQVDLRFFPDPDYKKIAIQYLQEEIALKHQTTADPHNLLERGDRYIISANETEICRFLKNRIGYSNCEKSLTKETGTVALENFISFIEKHKGLDELKLEKGTFGSDLIDVGTGEKIMDMKEACRLYLTHKYPNHILHYDDHEVVIAGGSLMEKVGKKFGLNREGERKIDVVEIDFTIEKPIPQSEIALAAKHVIYEKLFDRRIETTDLQMYDMDLKQEANRKFYVSVHRSKIANRIKQKRQNAYDLLVTPEANIKSKEIVDNNGLYRIHGFGKFDTNTLNNFIFNQLISKHPRLKYTKGQIKKKKAAWIFPIISSQVPICK